MKYLSLIVVIAFIVLLGCRDNNLDNDPNANWTAGEDWIDERDRKSYATVKIGDQIWMAESLNATIYSDQKSIPLVEENSGWEALDNDDEAYCYPHNDRANGDVYGAFYTWSAAMQGATGSNANPSGVQGVCPTGWHLPSDAEWKQLEMYLGMSKEDADGFGYRGTDEGGKLKEAGIDHWKFPNTGANNTSGFIALPSSIRNSQGGFYDPGNNAAFWSSTEDNKWAVNKRRLFYDRSDVYRQGYNKDNGLSVRCIKDL